MQWVPQPLAGISLGVAIFVAIELSVRLSDYVRHGVPISERATSIDDLLVTDSLGPHARSSSQFERYRINNLGYRGPDVDIAVRRGPVVAIMGSSESFGMAESPGKEWPRQLESILRADCNPSTVVVNAAFAGVSLPTATQNFRRRIADLGADAIVYYPQPTQYLLGRRPSPAEISPNRVAPLPRFRLRAISRLRDRIKNEIPAWLLTALRNRATRRARTNRSVFTGFPTERLSSFEEDLRVFTETATARTPIVMLVEPQHRFDDTTSVVERDWLRAWEKLLPRADGSLLIRFSDSASTIVRKVAEEEDVDFIEPALDTGRLRATMFSDPVHFTDAGAHKIAIAVARALAAKLPCSTATENIR